MSTSTQRLGPYSIAQRVTYSALEDPTTGVDLPVDGEIRFFCNGTIRGFFREDFTNSRFDVSGTGTSTGTVIAVEDANNLTTGSIMSLYSGATHNGTRSLVKVTNDSSLASGTTCLELINNSNSTTINVVATGLTTGKALDISNADAVTQGTLLDLHSNSSSTETRSLARIVNDNPAATGARCLELRNDSTSTTFILDHNGTSGQAMAIDSEQQTGEIFDIAVNTLTEGTALNLSDADLLTTGTLIDVHSNSLVNSPRSLVRIVNDHGSANQASCLELRNDALSTTMLIDHNGTSGKSLRIESAQLSGQIIDIDADGLTQGIALNVVSTTNLTTGSLAVFSSSSWTLSTRSIVKIISSESDATNATCLEIQQESTAPAIDFSGGGETVFKAPATTDVVTSDPETDPETGWIKIKVGASDRYIPFYAL